MPTFAQQAYKCNNIYSQTPCAPDAKKIEIKPALGVDCSQYEHKYSNSCQGESSFNDSSHTSKSQASNTSKFPIKQLSNEEIILIEKEFPWARPYPIDASRLPPNYTGLDSKKVFEIFKSKWKPLEKNKFEKDEEFKQRIKNLIIDASPISSNVDYAFLLEFHPEYDANTERYIINKFCDNGILSTNESNLIICRTTTAESNRRNYVASNAFGATTNVTEVYTKDIGIAFSKNSTFANRLFTKEGKINGYYFSDNFPLSIEKAKYLQKYRIGVLFIGRFINANIAYNSSTITPTINKPYSSLTEIYAPSFEPKQVVYYVIQTGEILSKKVF